MSDAGTASLGYLSWRHSPETRHYTGGLLVVSEEGFPREFRCTEPVRATSVQSILYGDSLRRYVLSTLIGGNLWQALQRRPPVLLINDRELWCVEEGIEAPMGLMLPADDAERMLEMGDAQGSEDSFMVNLPEGEQVVVSVRGGSASAVSTCEQLISQCSTRMNIYEPFSRVDAVLEALEKKQE